ncbi:hypothetical protein BGZ70_006255, partial [Mortierella alpina]
LEGHQLNPIKIGWNGAPPICTYCKKEGHFLKTCAERLSKICNSCHAPGHISAQCARFGEGDRKAAGKRPVSVIATTLSSSYAASSTNAASSSNATSFNTTASLTSPVVPTVAQTIVPTQAERVRTPSIYEFSDGDFNYESEDLENGEGMSDVQSEEDSAPEQPTQVQAMEVDEEDLPATSEETYKDQPPYTQIPATQTPVTQTPATQTTDNDTTDSNDLNDDTPSTPPAPAKGKKAASKKGRTPEITE